MALVVLNTVFVFLREMMKSYKHILVLPLLLSSLVAWAADAYRLVPAPVALLLALVETLSVLHLLRGKFYDAKKVYLV